MQQGQIIGQHDARQQARRSEAAQRSKREAAEAAAARQRRAQLEARGAAMRRVMRGLGAGQAGRALATWRRHCCQKPPATVWGWARGAMASSSVEPGAPDAAAAQAVAARRRLRLRLLTGSLLREATRAALWRWRHRLGLAALAQMGAHAKATHAHLTREWAGAERRLKEAEARLHQGEARLAGEAGALRSLAIEQQAWHEQHQAKAARLAGLCMQYALGCAACVSLSVAVPRALGRWRTAAAAISLEEQRAAAEQVAEHARRRVAAVEARTGLRLAATRATVTHQSVTARVRTVTTTGHTTATKGW